MGIFGGMADELRNFGASYQPHNENDEASATAAMDVPDDLPELLEGARDMANTMAEAIEERVAFNSPAAALFRELGGYLARAIDPVQDAAAEIRKAHQPDFERLDDPDVRQDAWDRVRNRR